MFLSFSGQGKVVTKREAEFREGMILTPSPKVASEQSTDMELVDLCTETQDERAYAVLYQRYAPELLRRLRRLLGERERVEDSLQQVFLQAFRHLSSYRGERPLIGWLHRIAERVVYDQYKKQWRSRTLLEKLGLQSSVPSIPQVDPERCLARQQLQVWIQLLLSRLSPKKRWVLTLCLLEGQTIEEVALQMEIPSGTVASRLFHARKELLTMMEKELAQQNLSWEDVSDAFE